jgi:nucleotide-binding universal stress UspA family protein
MIKSILVPTDGSSSSNLALEYGLSLAAKFQARVTGVYVVDIRLLEGPFFSDISGALGFTPYQNFLPKIQKILEDKAQTILDGFAARCTGAHFEPRVKRYTGIVSNVIAEEGKKVDIIVIAQRGEHAKWSTGLLGSTTESVVRKATKPVLVTPPTFRELKRVLVAYDGSAGANKALKVACELGLDLSLELDVLIVSHDMTWADSAREEVTEFIEPYRLPVDVAVREGKAEEEIVAFSQERGSDLVIMGAYGHSRIREFVLGSTTAMVIRTSGIPVLLTR